MSSTARLPQNLGIRPGNKKRFWSDILLHAQFRQHEFGVVKSEPWVSAALRKPAEFIPSITQTLVSLSV